MISAMKNSAKACYYWQFGIPINVTIEDLDWWTCLLQIMAKIVQEEITNESKFVNVLLYLGTGFPCDHWMNLASNLKRCYDGHWPITGRFFKRCSYDDILTPPFIQLSNVVNNIHKMELKFAYDDKDNKLNDIVNVLSMLFCNIKICNNADYFFTSKWPYCLRKSNPNHPNIIWYWNIAFFWTVSFARISLQESHCFWKQKHLFQANARNKCNCFESVFERGCEREISLQKCGEKRMFFWKTLCNGDQNFNLSASKSIHQYY